MAEEHVFFPCGEITLEGSYTAGDSRNAAVIAHPHPLYGGSMYDYVVSMVLSPLEKKGWSTLKFNFRGVGQSQGTHGHGALEIDDLEAAVQFLKSRGAEKIVAGGYSFGAAVALQAWPGLKALDVEPLILVALPASLMDVSGVSGDTQIDLAICGERDEIAPPEATTGVLDRLDKKISATVIPGTDHFFGGCQGEFNKIMENYLADNP